jgi:hypothetical protein
MLTFFRRIRKGFIGSGQARKYLLYALGEIALVVIGILIALQINNWNEWRKDRVKEREVLLDLKDNLERNITNIEESLSILSSYDNSAAIAFDFINDRIPYSDTLYRHFFFSRFNGALFLNISYDGYESLKSAGFGIMSSDIVKDQIMGLFEDVYKVMEKVSNYLSQEPPNQNPFILNNFVQHSGTLLEPKDPNVLKNDISYYSLLNSKVDARGFLRVTQQSGLDETQRVLQLIKEELGED